MTNVYLPKINFFERHYLIPMGYRLHKYAHMLENGQGLLAYTPPQMEVHQKKFNNKHFKNWLKTQRISRNNFGVWGSSLTKHFHMTCHEAGMRICIQHLGGPAP